MDDSSKYSESDDSENKPRRSYGEKQEKLVVQPIRCPMCSATLKCPGNVDPEIFLDRQFDKCMASEDKVCSRAIKAKGNAGYIAMRSKTR